MSNTSAKAGLSAALLLAMSALAASASAWSADSIHAEHVVTPGKTAPTDRETTWKNALARPPLSATAAFDDEGRLWLATVKDGHINLQVSTDKGGNFGAPLTVNAAPENIAADGENRPKIAFGSNGKIYISWTQSLAQPFSGNVRFSRSLDGGRSFSPPVTVNDDREIITHRFETLGVDRRGGIHLVWLDRRDQSAAAAKGEKYTGLAVYHATSTNEGASFSTNKKIADHSCECCRIALAVDNDATPVVFWRHIFGQNNRDHALRRLDGTSAMVRVSHDNWEVDACPHHGPTLAIGSDGVYHLAWFNNAPARHGLFYSRSRDGGQTFSAPLAFGDFTAQASHPQVLSLGARVWLAWKEFNGQESTVRIMHSTDDGLSWSAPVVLAATDGASDHPLLISDGVQAYLSWNTVKQGYRLTALGREKS